MFTLKIKGVKIKKVILGLVVSVGLLSAGSVASCDYALKDYNNNLDYVLAYIDTHDKAGYTVYSQNLRRSIISVTVECKGLPVSPYHKKLTDHTLKYLDTIDPILLVK